MTQNEVINKLSMEMALALGDLDTLRTCRIYIQMALSIGIEHFHVLEEEIIVLDKDGVECGRFKGLADAEKVLGINKASICKCLNGERHSAGGLMFIKTKDKELIPVKKTA
jgi:hypothetical protein